MYTIGIDPGTSGALTIIRTDDRSIVEVVDLPFITITTSTGKNRKRIEARTLHATLLRFQPLDAIWIELVHARPGEGAVQAFSFGHTLGAVESLAQTVCERVEKVAPAVWKRAHGITADKSEARALAQSITGDVQTYRRVRDTDRAESTLIALYGQLRGATQA